MTFGDFSIVLLLAAFGSLAGIVFGCWCFRGLSYLHELWDDKQWRKENAHRMPEVLRPYKEGRK